MSRGNRWLWAAAVLAVGISACVAADAPAYRTKNVIIAVMDGVRYSETFGDPKRELIPQLAKLESQGTLYADFRNVGVTVTRQGHSTIATGTWQTVPNGGPRQTMPTVFEYARSELGWPQAACQVVFGKGTYSYACYSSHPAYGRKLAPGFTIAIGENKPADDTKVLEKVFDVMATDKPRLIFVNFGTTDHMGHTDKWDQYTEAIRHCDEMMGKLWEKVQSTDGYKDATTVFFTNDHGRHNNREKENHGGFKSHGDGCEGCQHVMMLVLGPDVTKGAVIERQALEVDIAPTVGELLGFQTPLAEGGVMSDCLTDFHKVNTKAAKSPEAEKAVLLEKLRQRDLLRTIADATRKRGEAELAPSAGVELLMRAMLAAAAAAKEPAYRQFVEAWAKKHAGEERIGPHVARVLAELAADGGPAEYLAAAKACAAQEAAASDELSPACRAGMTARVAKIAGDQNLAAAAKASLGLAEATAADLAAQRQKLAVRPAPMACDFGRRPQKLDQPAEAEALRLLALADLAAALPADRIVRQACTIQQIAVSRGRYEIGALWADPTVSALNLYAYLSLGRFNSANPLPADGGTRPARPAARPAAKGVVETFYEGCFPYGYRLLEYGVNEAGHYGDGSAMADGAALLLFAESRGVRMDARLGPVWFRQQQAKQPKLPPVPAGCTRVLVQFGGGLDTTWTGSVSVEGGELVAVLDYLFEPNDRLDAKARTFVCTTANGMDGLVLDVKGGDEATIAFKATPAGLSATLGQLKKEPLQREAPLSNVLRAEVLAAKP